MSARVPVLALISPAKTLRDEASLGALPKLLAPSRPANLAKSDALALMARALSAAEISKVMSLSPALSAGVVAMFHAYNPAADEKSGCHQAALLYDGPAYKGLSFETLTKPQALKASHCIRFLSGLYGLLRPTDGIQPYRLEMSISPQKIGLTGAKSLAEYWCDDVTSAINETLGASGPAILLNIASDEYSKAVKLSAVRAGIKVISVRFEDGGKVKTAYAKKARGMMARHVCQCSSDTATISVDELKQFDAEGYSFSAKLSAEDDTLLVFTRSEGTAAAVKQGGGKLKKQKREE